MGDPEPREAMLAHDLTGLLALVRGRLALALEDLAGGADPRGDLLRALSEVQAAEAMVQDAVRGSAPGGNGRFDPVPILEEEIGRAFRAAPGVRVRLVDCGTGVRPRGSGMVFARAAANLLRNAARHARAEVIVRLAADGGALLVTVEDDGAGVTPDVGSRLFELGVHGGHGGSGIGLASARAMAEALGGDLSYARSELGGARFALRLPVAASGAAPAACGPRVLLVDDDPAILDVFQRLLQAGGLPAVGLPPDASTEELRRCVREFRPEVALVDVGFGDAGVRVLVRLRSVAPDLAARTLFFTGDVGTGAAERAAAASGHGVLPKTAPMQDFLVLLREVAAGPPAPT